MMKKDNIEPRLLTTQQVAKYMNIPLSTIYAMVQRKQIPFKRFGTKSIRFDRHAIDKWIDEQYSKSYHMN